MADTHSQDALPELEAERRGIARDRIRSYCFGGVGVLIFIAGLLLSENPIVWMICGGVALVVAVWKYRQTVNRAWGYTNTFKQLLIAPLLQEMDPSLQINPNSGLSMREFNHTGLFNIRADRMRSEDQISGRVGQTSICFSEVHAEYKTEVSTKSGTKEIWHDLFRGIVFIAGFNKSFEGITVVRPKNTGAAIAAWFAKNVPLLSSSSHQLVQLENPSFCSEFVTYSSDQIEARYILTPAMMERLCELNSRSEYTISMSFFDRCMYLAFPLDHDYFEPPLYKTLLDPDLLRDDREIIKFMYGIVKDLDLNTRIWGKG